MPVRYFVVNRKTATMHIYGCCQQTKARSIPIRLFDSPRELEVYAGRKLTLCANCRKKMQETK